MRMHNVLPMSRTKCFARTLPHKDSRLSHMYPSIDLGDDEVVHFSFGADEGAIEVSSKPRDYALLSDGRPSPPRQEAMQDVPPSYH